MSTEDDAPLEREDPVAGKRPDWMEVPDITVSEVPSPYEISKPERGRADRAEARHRAYIDGYATRERSGPPILGIVVIYVVLCLLVGMAFWFVLPRIW